MGESNTQAIERLVKEALYQHAGNIPKSREVSLVVTKLEEALLWLTKVVD